MTRIQSFRDPGFSNVKVLPPSVSLEFSSLQDFYWKDVNFYQPGLKVVRITLVHIPLNPVTWPHLAASDSGKRNLVVCLVEKEQADMAGQ